MGPVLKSLGAMLRFYIYNKCNGMTLGVYAYRKCNWKLLTRLKRLNHSPNTSPYPFSAFPNLESSETRITL